MIDGKKSISAESLTRLKEFIIDKAKLCVHSATGTFEDRFVTPSYAVAPGSDDESLIPERSLSGHYLQMYDWDACFFSQGAYRAGINGIAKSIVSNFLSFRSSDGYIPRTISPKRVWDQGDVCKPFLSQALLHEYKHETHKRPLPDTWIDGLGAYLEYLERNRLCGSGLYTWRNVLESGVDNNLSMLAPGEAAKDENRNVGDFPDSVLAASDLNSYLIAEFKAFAELSRLAGNQNTAPRYDQLAADLETALEDRLWNSTLGLYCNFDSRSGEQVPIRTWTGLIPALLGTCRTERTQEIIERNLLREKHFLRPAGISSVAASEPLYNQAMRGLYGRVIVSNWQGPMWILPNVLAVRCLLSNNYQSAAQDIALRVIATMIKSLENRGTLFENYCAETGKPLWAPQFMSWNILALELIDILE